MRKSVIVGLLVMSVFCDLGARVRAEEAVSDIDGYKFVIEDGNFVSSEEAVLPEGMGTFWLARVKQPPLPGWCKGVIRGGFDGWIDSTFPPPPGVRHKGMTVNLGSAVHCDGLRVSERPLDDPDGFYAGNPDLYGFYGDLSRANYPRSQPDGVFTLDGIQRLLDSVVLPVIQDAPNVVMQAEIQQSLLEHVDLKIEEARIKSQQDVDLEFAALRDQLLADLKKDLCDKKSVPAGSTFCQ
jgi:hypothetical protein